ncbi:hypothetical protein FPOA_14094 [Fusarium poae]|uniref:Uncharacterized protein n=1 Tax=Fusarium poae TaxID=36050 RepID=A0A1B8A3N1_FUSPO|nr:hypothetical protein FPOA_14094 [Fusarium poae]
MADPTEPEIVVGPDAFGAQRTRRLRTLTTKAQESLEAQEKVLEKSAGTAKRTATNTTRITSRITNDGLQEGKNDTDPGAAMLQKVFGVLRILRDEFSKQQEATLSMIGDQQKTIRELEQKLDEYMQEMQETKAQMAEELRQVRGQLDSILGTIKRRLAGYRPPKWGISLKIWT